MSIAQNHRGEDNDSALVWRVTESGVWGPLELSTLDPAPDGWDYVVANDVSDQDAGVVIIVGQSNGNAVEWTVTLTDDGGLLAGSAAILSGNAEATATNNLGMACGSAEIDPQNFISEAVVWMAGIPLILDVGQSGSAAFPLDVNDNGVVVGTTSLYTEAAVWPSPDGAMISLEKFLKNSPFDSLTRAHAVNKSGEIVGYAANGCPDLPQLAAHIPDPRCNRIVGCFPRCSSQPVVSALVSYCPPPNVTLRRERPGNHAENPGDHRFA